MGEYKGYGLWYIPDRRQVRWHKKKAFIREEVVGPNGIPSREAAVEALNEMMKGGKAVSPLPVHVVASEERTEAHFFVMCTCVW